MARKPSYSLQCGLTRAETIAGWCYLPFYLVLLSVVIQYVCRWLSIPLTDLALNITYFVINLTVVLIIFRRFLRQRKLLFHKRIRFSYIFHKGCSKKRRYVYSLEIDIFMCILYDIQ